MVEIPPLERLSSALCAQSTTFCVFLGQKTSCDLVTHYTSHPPHGCSQNKGYHLLQFFMGPAWEWDILHSKENVLRDPSRDWHRAEAAPQACLLATCKDKCNAALFLASRALPSHTWHKHPACLYPDRLNRGHQCDGPTSAVQLHHRVVCRRGGTVYHRWPGLPPPSCSPESLPGEPEPPAPCQAAASPSFCRGVLQVGALGGQLLFLLQGYFCFISIPFFTQPNTAPGFHSQSPPETCAVAVLNSNNITIAPEQLPRVSALSFLSVFLTCSCETHLTWKKRKWYPVFPEEWLELPLFYVAGKSHMTSLPKQVEMPLQLRTSAAAGNKNESQPGQLSSSCKSM